MTRAKDDKDEGEGGIKKGVRKAEEGKRMEVSRERKKMKGRKNERC